MKRPAITPAMRLQVLKLFGAVVLCQLCGGSVYIADAEIDHHQALIDGGSHDFQTNMRPVCRPCHAEKSAVEHKNNAKAKRLATKHSQPKQPGTIKSRGFQGSRKFNGEINWRAK